MYDLRSDTVTRPDEGMRQAMASAQVGDDVFGDDPTVRSLEARVADLLGKSASLFFPSGTQSNLCAVLTHCQRGHEVLTGEHYHVFGYEARGISALGGVSLHPLQQRTDGGIDPDRIRAAIKPDDPHFPITSLLSLENTHYGQVVPLDLCFEMAGVAKQASLPVHLDGARLGNAAVAMNTSLEGACIFADTVSFCLSKGLGAPAGSVLVGPKEYIDRARRLRKMLGGGMRQVGVLAAAAHYALDTILPKLAEDHQKATSLNDALVDTPKVKVLRDRTQTNMVYLTLPEGGFDSFEKALRKQNVIVTGDSDSVRMVLHHDIPTDAIPQIANAINAWSNG